MRLTVFLCLEAEFVDCEGGLYADGRYWSYRKGVLCLEELPDGVIKRRLASWLLNNVILGLFGLDLS